MAAKKSKGKTKAPRKSGARMISSPKPTGIPAPKRGPGHRKCSICKAKGHNKRSHER